MKLELTAQVGADGVLLLHVPLGREDANKVVRVVVETVEERRTMSQEEWSRFVHGMAGRIADPTFDRHPQGEYEQRDELP